MCHKAGGFIVKRKTIGKRMSAKLKEIKAELTKRRHQSNAKTGKWLQSVVRGYFQYHAIPGNWKQLWVFRKGVLRMWLRQLRRRSQRGVEHRHPYRDLTSSSDGQLKTYG